MVHLLPIASGMPFLESTVALNEQATVRELLYCILPARQNNSRKRERVTSFSAGSVGWDARILPAHVKKLISVCCPAYNESENIPELVRRLGVVADSLSAKYDFEFIICEHGSVDDTYQRLLKAHEADPRVKIVQLA